MKFFCLGLVCLLATEARAETWICDDGDYHLTIKGAPGNNTILFQICEFTYCMSSQLSVKGMLVNSDVANSRYDYGFSENNTAETLVLDFNEQGAMVDAKQMSGDAMIAEFDSCQQE